MGVQHGQTIRGQDEPLLRMVPDFAADRGSIFLQLQEHLTDARGDPVDAIGQVDRGARGAPKVRPGPLDTHGCPGWRCRHRLPRLPRLHAHALDAWWWGLHIGRLSRLRCRRLSGLSLSRLRSTRTESSRHRHD